MKTPEQSMSAWVASVRQAAHQLRYIGADITDEDITLVLLNGLPLTYEQLAVALDSTPPDDLTLEYVVTRLLNEESRQNATLASSSNTALAAATKLRTPLARITCFKCGQKGHYQVNCPQASTTAKQPAAASNLASAAPNFAF